MVKDGDLSAYVTVLLLTVLSSIVQYFVYFCCLDFDDRCPPRPLDSCPIFNCRRISLCRQGEICCPTRCGRAGCVNLPGGRLTYICKGLHYNPSTISVKPGSWSRGNAFAFKSESLRFKLFGPAKSDTVLPTALHRCDIFRKGTVLPSARTSRWAPQTCYTLLRNTVNMLNDLI